MLRKKEKKALLSITMTMKEMIRELAANECTTMTNYVRRLVVKEYNDKIVSKKECNATS